MISLERKIKILLKINRKKNLNLSILIDIMEGKNILK
jgi:hypothetical protein